MPPLALGSLPRAILHIDADAFFASCEQANNPSLRGKPVVTGKERGIASAVSYEAKALGIKRGMRFIFRPITRPTACIRSGYSPLSAATPTGLRNTASTSALPS